MAKLQSPRKRGIVDLFVVLILVVTIVGIGMLAFGNNNKIEELSRDEFFGIIYTDDVKTIAMSGVSGSGNEATFIVQGIYTDEVQTAYISEGLADIYQELKDMAASFQIGEESIMHDAVVLCREAFDAHWGQKLLAVMRALHALSRDNEIEE